VNIREYRGGKPPAALERSGVDAFPPEAVAGVRKIVADVRDRGDAAVRDYTRRFDRVEVGRLRVARAEFTAARGLAAEPVKRVFRRVRDNIRGYQEAAMARDWTAVRSDGAMLGEKVSPVASAGLYIPGGTAPLVSTVFMTVVPAQVAGVPRIALATPPGPGGKVNPWILAAADFLGVDEVYRAGGAQGIAALAFGTESVPRTEMIAGPGNSYVTLAKMEVCGFVRIDMPAGPSEIAIIADGSARPRVLAADMLAQAEHGPGGSCVLISTSRKLLREVARELSRAEQELPRRRIAAANLKRGAFLVKVPSIARAVELANRLAPEHLEIVTGKPEAVLQNIENAGAVFLGESSPVAVGDYIAGPSHVLPTGGAAAAFSPLSANDFLKKSSVVGYSREALRKEAESVALLARLEGLEAHARSIELRLEEGGR